ncbi:hypothetical protein HG531_010015 [Fusarium graminearum]|nr:hypothetical protein HG531_010015 [Fusarium graminearum]
MQLTEATREVFLDIGAEQLLQELKWRYYSLCQLGEERDTGFMRPHEVFQRFLPGIMYDQDITTQGLSTATDRKIAGHQSKNADHDRWNIVDHYLPDISFDSDLKFGAIFERWEEYATRRNIAQLAIIKLPKTNVCSNMKQFPIIMRLVLLELSGCHSRVDSFLKIEMEVRCAVDRAFDSLDVLAHGGVLNLLIESSGSSGAIVTTEVSDREDSLPVAGSFISSAGGTEAKASSGESTLRPSVLNVGKVPVNNFRSSKLVKLVSDINQCLDRGDIDVVNTGEVKDNRLKNRSLIVLDSLDVAGFTVVPGTVTKLTQQRGVGSSAFGKDCLGKVVEVVRSIGVVEALGESVDEDTGIGSTNDDLGVGSVAVVKGKKASSEGTLALVDGTRAGSTIANIGLHGSDTNDTHEATAGLEETEDNNSSGHGNCGVDSVLNGAEDGYDNTSEEDDDLDWGDTPKLVDDLGRGNDISDSVNDDTSKTGVGDVEENGGQGIKSEQDNDGILTTGNIADNADARLFTVLDVNSGADADVKQDDKGGSEGGDEEVQLGAQDQGGKTNGGIELGTTQVLEGVNDDHRDKFDEPAKSSETEEGDNGTDDNSQSGGNYVTGDIRKRVGGLQDNVTCDLRHDSNRLE